VELEGHRCQLVLVRASAAFVARSFSFFARLYSLSFPTCILRRGMPWLWYSAIQFYPVNVLSCRGSRLVQMVA
jgi:hypothetical protein